LIDIEAKQATPDEAFEWIQEYIKKTHIPRSKLLESIEEYFYSLITRMEIPDPITMRDEIVKKIKNL